MRYTSALKILQYMRASYGRQPSISTVCRGVALSYQPTHYHIKQLEKLAVLGTIKSGRESLCMFVNSPAAALWLAMLCQHQKAAGLAAELLRGLRPYLSQHRGEFDCIAVLPEENRLIATTQGAKKRLSSSLAARCRAITAALRVETLDRGGLLDHFGAESGLVWTRRAVIIAGHQDFWEYALTAGEGLGLVLPPPAE